MKFYDYSNVLIQASSSGGKTHFLKQILEQKADLFFEPVTCTIIIYEHWQSLYDEMLDNDPNIIFSREIPSQEQLEEWVKDHRHSILCVDDKQLELANSPQGAAIFMKLSHHLKISCFFLLQGATMKGKYAGDVVRNSHYTILLKSGREAHLVRSIGTQMNDYAALAEAYKQATTAQFSYLCINNHPRASLIERYSTHILPSDRVCTLFVSKKHH